MGRSHHLKGEQKQLPAPFAPGWRDQLGDIPETAPVPKPCSPVAKHSGSHRSPIKHPTTPWVPQGLTFIVTARRVVE